MFRVKVFLLSFLFLLGSVSQTEAASKALEQYVYPLMTPRLTSKFGMRKHPVRGYSKMHRGIDLAAPIGSHVRAFAAGKIVFAGRFKGFGKLVTIEHQGGYTSLYGHLNTIYVNLGQQVKAGEVIGKVGTTGLSTGPHLHFEWRKAGKALDPLKEFPDLLDKPSG